MSKIDDLNSINQESIICDRCKGVNQKGISDQPVQCKWCDHPILIHNK